MILEVLMRLGLKKLIEVSANLDDMNPQWYEPLMERLFRIGALDVVLVPAIMKKSRPAVVVQILASPALKKKIVDCLLEETTTLGVRVQTVERFELSREIKTVKTPYGAVAVKIAKGPKGDVRNVWPEYESCRALALKTRKPVKTIFQAALKASP